MQLWQAVRSQLIQCEEEEEEEEEEKDEEEENMPERLVHRYDIHLSSLVSSHLISAW